MKKRTLYFLLVWMFFMYSMSGFAQQFSAKYKVFLYDSMIRIYVQVPFIINDQAAYNFKYTIFPEYGDQEVLMTQEVFLQNLRYDPVKNCTQFYFDLNQLDRSEALLYLTWQYRGSDEKMDIPLSFVPTKMSDTFAFFNEQGLLILDNFIIQGQPFKVSDVRYDDVSTVLGVNYYHFEFSGASKPVDLKKQNLDRELKADSVFSVFSGQMYQFDKTGLYHFKLKKEDFYGLGLRVMRDTYPEIDNPEEDLYPPFAYLISDEESAFIQSASERKKVFDKILLKHFSGNISLALSNLSTYFQRVRQANLFFTNYKKGWKTDKGMVYIVYGPPQEILKSKDLEQWVYHHPRFSRVNFTFQKRSNQFTDYHYQLIRYREYEPVWKDAIEKWQSEIHN